MKWLYKRKKYLPLISVSPHPSQKENQKNHTTLYFYQSLHLPSAIFKSVKKYTTQNLLRTLLQQFACCFSALHAVEQCQIFTQRFMMFGRSDVSLNHFHIKTHFRFQGVTQSVILQCYHD